jgi:hypothetical protein
MSTTLPALPDEWYVLARLDLTISAAVPHWDPVAPLARRWGTSKQQPGDESVLRHWLRQHPDLEVRHDGTAPLVADLSPAEAQPSLFDVA